ncbi:hypothetical protein Caci_7588 [Catenulispora acidiphila DSM 44928]|uniref:Uncharacterized protein n=1 Tax=Catenulispora acidiphila (strain DSM 44928 / JCM 14897 / NBRC 102108 / NRRL B-24433 / ID139908) TaxID=479433 RepID=C7QBC1_CATAD|nr:hypothetical protein Caci_7588 [Catenulispora acidiphila DSM 44928]
MEISVTLRDAADGGVIARTVVPSESLPPAFDGTQMLEAAGQVWRVVRAEPAFREEYELIGEMELTLRRVEQEPRVEMMPARDIHFSMSSISDRLPDIAGPLDGRTVLLVKDDLWRDVELVSARGAAAIEENLLAIRRIQDEFRSGPGFTEIHLRTDPAAPLAGVTLTVEDLAAGLGTTTHFVRPVAIEGRGVVQGGYALSVVDGVHVYGLVDTASRVTVAGVYRTGIAGADVAGAFGGLLRERGLELVDWRGGLRTDDAEVLVGWFGAPPQPLWR